MTYAVTHTSTYDYRDSVSVSHHVLRLTPRDLPQQRCLCHEMQLHPPPAVATPHVDYFGNAVTFVTVEGAHRKLTVAASSTVALTRLPLRAPAESPAWA